MAQYPRGLTEPGQGPVTGCEELSGNENGEGDGSGENDGTRTESGESDGKRTGRKGTESAGGSTETETENESENGTENESETVTENVTVTESESGYGSAEDGAAGSHDEREVREKDGEGDLVKKSQAREWKDASLHQASWGGEPR